MRFPNAPFACLVALVSLAALACDDDTDPLEPRLSLYLDDAPVESPGGPIFEGEAAAPERLDARYGDAAVSGHDVRLRASGDLGGDDGSLLRFTVVRADGAPLEPAVEFECTLRSFDNWNQYSYEFRAGERAYRLALTTRDVACFNGLAP